MQRYSPQFFAQRGDTAIYELDLSRISERVISSVTVLDDRIISGGTSSDSGFDLDFFFVSDFRLSGTGVANVLATGSYTPVINYSGGVAFTPGFQQAGNRTFENTNGTGTLSGTTTGNLYAPSQATLNALDGSVDGSNLGYLSLGEGGNVTFQLSQAIGTVGRYVYLGDVGGGNDDVFVSFNLSSEDRGVDLFGTSGNDTILLGQGVNVGVGSGNDRIDGAGGNDQISTIAGRDTLIGGAGNDILDGGYDIDTALFLGSGGQYTVSRNPNLTITVSGPDGTDTLIGIEKLTFTDNTVPTLSVASLFGFGADISSVEVVAATYQFFTGRVPEQGGFTFLIESSNNATDLNDATYANFNQENRFINFANNLGSFGEARDAFQNAYGNLSFAQTVRSAYDSIVGISKAQSQGVNTDAAINFFLNSEGFYTAIANERVISSGVSLDQAKKVVAIGSILNEAMKSDVGRYAEQINILSQDTFLDNQSSELGQNIFAIA